MTATPLAPVLSNDESEVLVLVLVAHAKPQWWV
jgi:hypothetical protein